MPISSITQQPAASSMNAAYRPVLLKVACVGSITVNTFTCNVVAANPSVVIVNIAIQGFTVSTPETISFSGFGVVSSEGVYTISSWAVFSTYIQVTLGDSSGGIPVSIYYAIFAEVTGNVTGVGVTVNSSPVSITTSISPPPVVYCDIYIGGIYYKTISKTKYDSIDSTNTYWLFDIQDALQEMLPWAIGNNGAAYVQNANGIVSVQCYFRSSSFDTNGFIVQDTPIPIQATDKNVATAGGGTASNTFFAVLATLQHAEIQDLATALSAYVYGTWGTSFLPLSHRNPYYKIRNIAASDYYPLFVVADITIPKIRINYMPIGTSTYTTLDVTLPSALNLLGGSIFLMGAGQKNINAITALISYTLDFSNIANYNLQLLDGSGTVQATTPTYVIDNFINSDMIRIHFLNYCGQFDAADFQKPAISHEDKSTSFQKTLPYNFQRRDTGFLRQNIISNDTYTTIRISTEDEMQWLQELADSPQLFIEETRNQTGVTNDYIPLIKVDGKFDKQKNNGSEFQYEFKLQFKLANENIILRN